MYEAAAAADCFEVCVTSKLPGRGHVFVTFCTTQKERKNVPFAENIEVLQTSIQHTAAAASHRNN